MKGLRHIVLLMILPPLVISLGGCRSSSALNAADQTWLWLVVPLGGFILIGGVIVWSLRRRQLRRWDIATQPREPSTRTILVGTVIAAIAILVVFVVLNLRVDIDPGQRLVNLGLWALGTIVGTTLSLALGLKVAEQS